LFNVRFETGEEKALSNETRRKCKMKREIVTRTAASIAVLAVMALVTALFMGCNNPANSPADPETPLGAPLNVQLFPAERQLTVTWDAVSRAESYAVYYGSAADTSNGGTPPSLPATGSNVEYYGKSAVVISSLTNGTTYYVWVKAVNATGESPLSEVKSATPQIPVTPPETPLNVRVTGLFKELLVSWDAADGAVTYEIYMGADSASAEKKGESGGVRGAISGLETGVEYTVRVKAVNSAGNSPFSAPVKGTPVAAQVFSKEDEDPIGALAAYLRGLDPNTAVTPYPVALNGFNLSEDLAASNDPLGRVYAAVGAKYFSLDLSGCEGDLGNGPTTAPRGKDRLVSLVLPGSLTSYREQRLLCLCVPCVHYPAGKPYKHREQRL
jgi:hypothetical protein